MARVFEHPQQGLNYNDYEGSVPNSLLYRLKIVSELTQQQPARQSSETAISNAETTPARGRGSALKVLKPLPSPDSKVKRGRRRPPNVSSGTGNSPRPIGSARAFVVGTGSPNLAMGAKK